MKTLKPKPYIRLYVTIVLACLLFAKSSAQNYTDTGLKLLGTYNSSINWVDLDGDGYFDLSISGFNPLSSSPQGRIYFFEAGAIKDSVEIVKLLEGNMSWADFNNDNIPDLLYAGEGSSYLAAIDTFNLADTSYSTFSSDFLAVKDASIDWGDFDNDGDFDVLIAGELENGEGSTNLYQNNNGVFSNVAANLPGIINGMVGFIDFDLDMDLDIFICGEDINSNKYTRLWENNLGYFSITDYFFINLKNSYFNWADYNDDGYPDVVLIGDDGSDKRGLLYLNNEGNSFLLADTVIAGSRAGSIGFGDVDNDNDLDLFISGFKQDAALYYNLIYTNDNSDSLKPTSFTYNYIINSYFQFGDFDNDFDLDFAVNGFIGGTASTNIIENNSSTPNSPPTAPDNLSAEVTATKVTLKWDHATDNGITEKNLTYNMYIGTSSENYDIVSPLAKISTGYRKISVPGYIQDTSWFLQNLPLGTYYWGVQAIDNALGTSTFSDESSFTIETRFTDSPYSETPNDGSPALYIDCDHDNDYDMILSGSAKLIFAENNGSEFSQSDYDTIHDNSFTPIKTISANDYNNNNEIDLTFSGLYNLGDDINDSTLFLFGYNSSFDYTILTESLIDTLDFEYVKWVDLNNDGLQDILTSGRDLNLKPVTQIYKNLGDSTFQKIIYAIRGFYDCGAVEADFDNDMDIDIIIYGIDSTNTPNTYLYVNNGDFKFTEQLIPNNPLFRTYYRYNILSGDFDLNGELDFYMVGASEQLDVYARVFLNNNLEFINANLPIRSWLSMSNYWTDYDYDGDLDIYSVSVVTNPDKAKIYINDNQSLEELTIDLGDSHALQLPFVATNLDKQNGLDFIMKINTGDYHQYYDNWVSQNTISVAPDNTGYYNDDLDIILTWDKIPSCTGCTYNIRIGTQEDNTDILSPMSDLNTGFRYVVQPGNAFLNNKWKISDLPVGEYYWNVQAVDLANEGGPWSIIDTFKVSHVNSEFSNNTVCLNDTTFFSDLSVANDEVIKWKWDFDDGTTSNLQNPSHVFTAADTFNVGLWAYSLSGDSSLRQHDVIVKKNPIASFNTDIACHGTATTYSNLSDVESLSVTLWKWKFGDGDSIMTENPGSHGFLSPGDYDSKLIIQTSNGCSDTITKAVTVAEIPSISISANGALIFCEGDSVSLNVENNANYTYQWKLNNIGLTGADSSSLKVKSSGDYLVEVTNTIGNCLESSEIVTIVANSAPLQPTISAHSASSFCSGDSVKLSVTYNPDYSYKWNLNEGSVGIDSSSLIVKTQGNYTLNVSNENNCTSQSTNSIEVNVFDLPSIPSVNLSGPLTFCNGDSVVLSVSNNPDNLYQWKNEFGDIEGQTSYKITIKSTGSYYLQIENTNNCFVQTDNFNITVNPNPDELSITASGDISFCQGGAVALSVLDNPDYTYQWRKDGGPIGSDLNEYTASSSGAYTLEVTNQYNCSSAAINSMDVEVYDNPTVPSLSLTGSPVFCEGESASLSIPFEDGYTYQWKNGASVLSGETSNSISITESGDYSLEVRNANGCAVVSNVETITVNPIPAALSISASDNLSFCQGGSVALSVSDNTDYNYQWRKDGGDIGTDLNEFIASSSGNYSLEVTNQYNCSANSANSVDVEVYDNPTVPSLSLTGSSVFCEGESATLSIPFENGYTYQWKNGASVLSGETSNSISITESGDYSLEVRNANGCTVVSNVEIITVNPIPAALSILTSDDLSFCEGNSVVLSVSDIVNYTYQWRKDGGAIGTDLNEYIAKISGTYNLEVTNQYNCSANSANSVDLEVYDNPTVPSLSLIGSSVFCEGESATLGIPYEDGYTYQWKKGVSVLSAETSNSISITESGDYSLEVSNVNGCTVVSNVETITVNPSPPALSISASGDLRFCQGGSVALSVSDNSDYTYQWKKDGGTVGSDSNEYITDASGSYSLEVSNTFNCSALSVADIVVEVFSNPTVPTINLSGAKVFCSGSSIVLSVLDNVDYSYQWQENGNNISGENTNSIEVNNSGSYSLLVSNSNNCNVQTGAEEVTVLPSPASPTITYTGDLEFCEGGSVSLSVTDNPDYTYEWKLGSGAIGSDSNTLTATNQGTYSLIISDPNNCEALSSNTIDVSYLPVPNQPIIQASGSLVFCEGDSVLLYFTQEAGTSIVWKNGVSPISTTSDSFYAKVGGVYSVEVENASGCSSASSNTKTVIVNDIPNPVSIGWTGTLEFCDDQSTTLSVTEQTGCSYQWYKDAEVLIGENTSSLATSQSGDYYVRIKNESFCEYITDRVSVKVYARPVAPTITADGSTTICPSESVELSVESTSYDYQWKLDGLNISDANTNTFLAFDEGKYTLEIFNSICSNTTRAIDIVHKPAFEKPVLSAQGPNIWVLSCDNDQAQVYRWYYDGNLIPQADNYVYVANQNLGDYFVTVNDGGDCFTPSDIITIPVDLTGLEEEIAIFGDINIYPNPTPGVFTIEMDNQIIGILHLRIVNMAGKELFNIKHSKTTKFFSTQMDLSGQGKGVYFIEFRFEKDHTVRKVMVE